MEKKAIRVAYGEALVKLGETNDKVVVLDADLANATMTNGFKKAFHPTIQLRVGYDGGLAGEIAAEIDKHISRDA